MPVDDPRYTPLGEIRPDPYEEPLDPRLVRLGAHFRALERAEREEMEQRRREEHPIRVGVPYALSQFVTRLSPRKR